MCLARLSGVFILLLCALAGAAADPAFSLVIRTDWTSDGSSSPHQFTLPLRPGSTYDCTVDWGDGSTQTITTSASPTHTYATAGTYTVSITERSPGGFPSIYFNFAGDRGKVAELSNWGTGHWSSLAFAFAGCQRMTITASDGATADTGAVTDFTYAWASCTSLTGFPLIDTGAGSDFSRAWYGCSNLATFPLLDTSAGSDFSETWTGCTSLTSFPLIDTGRGTTFFDTWGGCTALTTFPLLNTAHGTNFASAWNGCTSLTSFPLIDTSSGLDFGGAWSGCAELASFPALDTHLGTTFDSAWKGCLTLTSFPLLDLQQAVSLTQAWSGCTTLSAFPVLNVHSAIDLSYAWYGCSALTSFPLLDTSSAVGLSYAWSGCASLGAFPPLDLRNVTNLDNTWSNCTNLTGFPLLDTAQVTSFTGTWMGCSALTGFPAIATGQATSLYMAWYGCSNLHIFPALDLHSLREGSWCFHGVTLDVASYDRLLNGLVSGPVAFGGIFDGGNSCWSQAAKAAHDALTSTYGWTITDNGPLPSIHSLSAAAAQTGAAFTYEIRTEGTIASLTVSGLPAWLSFDSGLNTVSGTAPSTPESATFQVTIHALNGDAISSTVTVHVNAADAPVITPDGDTVPTTVFSGLAFSYHVTASHAPTLFAASNLPSGVAIDAATGVISGTASTLGTFTIALTATNASGTGVGRLDLIVVPPPDASNTTDTSGASSSCGLGGGLALFVFSLTAAGRLRRQRR